MNRQLQKELDFRNNSIIKAILDKMQSCCPGSIALIGIAGSFCSGDFNEKSDLDLCIIVDDDNAKTINSCFILGDVAHDLYCSHWSRLEKMSEYSNPHVTKLFDLDIVFNRDEDSLKRYMKLRKIGKAKLTDTKENFLKAKKHLDNALKEYANVMLNENYSDCLYSVFEMFIHIEYAIYMINNTYIKRGTKRILEEISEMELLPEKFMQYYSRIIECDTVNTLKKSSTDIIKIMKDYFIQLEKKKEVKKEITPDDLTGTYEEIFSNWRSKMHHAVRIDNKYLSFIAIASCQKFYNEMASEYRIPRINVLRKYNPRDLKETAKGFDDAMEEWRALYDKLGILIRKYSSLDEFVKDYLKTC